MGRNGFLYCLIATASACLYFRTAQAQSQTWPAVIGARKSQTVLIRVESPDTVPDFGTGVLISETGYILTAKHLMPDDQHLKSGNYLITVLLGWTKPSIDFSKAKKATLAYPSPSKDFAVLKMSAPSGVKGACVGQAATTGGSLLVMGYPGGGNLRSTAGVTSGQAADGLLATDASVGKGNSGGPVFDDAGRLIGILLQGSSNKNGEIELGFYLPTKDIYSTLSSRHFLSTSCTNTVLAFSLPRISFSYHLSETKSDHDGASPSTRSYSRSFSAQPGYKIASVDFKAGSVNHVTSGPQLLIRPDGSGIDANFSIESGPFYDQWRGWIDGDVVTEQIPKGTEP